MTEGEIRAAFESYFAVLCRTGVTAADMLAEAVSHDFETGFADGYRWKGPDGLQAFLEARAGFVDERHDVREILGMEDVSPSETRVQTRLEFSLYEPESGEELTGSAFHTWLLRRDADGRVRVAAQIVDGFADLNEPARLLFATPEEGLNR